jgi:hypothetical protein
MNLIKKSTNILEKEKGTKKGPMWGFQKGG